MFKFLIALCTLMTTNVYADSNQLEVGFGPSLPKGTSTFLLPTGVSRANGGEKLYINFKTSKNISSIKLTAYSNSKAGKVLIRNGNIGLKEVMLSHLSSVSIEPKQLLESIDLVAEGFANNDASLFLQIVSNDDLSTKEFMVTRSGAFTESIGEYFEEKNYARFTLAQLQLLMKISEMPTMDDLAGHTYVCSIYDLKSDRLVDYKTRLYFLGKPPNVLQSLTDIQAELAIWIRNEFGWTISSPYDAKDCGKISMMLYIRKTPEGNLIGEWNFDLEDYISSCMAKGYGRQSSRESILEWSRPSMINEKFVNLGYEFCRQLKL